MSVDGIDERLTPTARASVLRILQEALQNVRKHAAASRVVIGLEGDALVIADNGRGFDLMRLASRASRNFGLQFMRERAELIGGQLQIESRQGEGTRILLRLPGQASENTARRRNPVVDTETPRSSDERRRGGDRRAGQDAGSSSSTATRCSGAACATSSSSRTTSRSSARPARAARRSPRSRS